MRRRKVSRIPGHEIGAKMIWSSSTARPLRDAGLAVQSFPVMASRNAAIISNCPGFGMRTRPSRLFATFLTSCSRTASWKKTVTEGNLLIEHEAAVVLPIY